MNQSVSAGRGPGANARGRAFPPGQRDPDIVRAKALARTAVRKSAGNDGLGRPPPIAGCPDGDRAVRMAHDQRVSMWECVLLTSGAAPLTAPGPLRWVASLDGHRLVGSHLPGPGPKRNGAVIRAGPRGPRSRPRRRPGRQRTGGRHVHPPRIADKLDHDRHRDMRAHVSQHRPAQRNSSCGPARRSERELT